MKYSYDSEGLIAELQMDIAEYGVSEVWAYSKIIEGHKSYVDYDWKADASGKPRMARPDEKMELMPAQKLLELFIEQNRII